MSDDIEARQDDDPEEFAETVGVDPTVQEVDEYREKIGDPVPEPSDPEPEALVTDE